MEHYDEFQASYNQSMENVEEMVEEIETDFPSAVVLWNVVVDILKDFDRIHIEHEKYFYELKMNF